MHDDDPAGTRLPIKIDSTSNGEFAPIPLDQVQRTGNRHAMDRAGDLARRHAVSRRQFLISACGAASTLLAFNEVNAAAGRAGGHFAVDPETADDLELAAAQVGGDEFILDVQGHYVNPTGAWLKRIPDQGRPLSWAPKTDCPLADLPGPRSYLQCLGPEQFIKDVFMDSDTDLMVLSFVPSRRETEPLTIEEAAATRDIVAELDGSHRLLLHGRVNPNQPGDMEDMERLVESFNVAAFKTYTQWGPDGRGYFLDDDLGRKFIERALKLGVNNIAIHKGIPFGPQSYQHSLCGDVGRAARDYPDMNFLIYHSGFVPGQPEGPYDPRRDEGIDGLITSVLENGIPRPGNVYAELGSTWRYLMRDPQSAAHALGKLFKHLGEDNILWGTDSIWYGSPQDQIQAFRTFQIDDELQQRHGYPKITPQMRAKVFGLNATRPYRIDLSQIRSRIGGDQVARQRAGYLERPTPGFRTYGPRTRRDFLNLMAF